MTGAIAFDSISPVDTDASAHTTHKATEVEISMVGEAVGEIGDGRDSPRANDEEAEKERLWLEAATAEAAEESRIKNEERDKKEEKRAAAAAEEAQTKKKEAEKRELEAKQEARHKQEVKEKDDEGKENAKIYRYPSQPHPNPLDFSMEALQAELDDFKASLR